MGFFDVDFDGLVWQQLPVLLRKGRMYSWLRVLIAPVKYVYGLFAANRTKNLYNLAHNSQVFSLEAALNDVFDSGPRRIYIIDTIYAEALPLYLAAELRPVPLYRAAEALPVYLYTSAEIVAADSADVFIVMVPNAIFVDLSRLRAVVDQYRLPGKAGYRVAGF